MLKELGLPVMTKKKKEETFRIAQIAILEKVRNLPNKVCTEGVQQYGVYATCQVIPLRTPTSFLEKNSTPNIPRGQWKSNFINYMKASNYVAKPNNVQVSALRFCVGNAANVLIEASNAPKETLAQTIEMLNRYFCPKQSEFQTWCEFFSRKQSPKKSITDYAISLTNMVTLCCFGQLEERCKQVQFLNGLKAKKWINFLIAKNASILEDMVQNVLRLERQQELMEPQRRSYYGSKP